MRKSMDNPLFSQILALTSAILLVYTLLISMEVNINPEQAEFEIAKGSTLHKITRQLKERGIINHSRLFMVVAKIKFQANDLKAGKFYLNGIHTYSHLINRLCRAVDHQVKVIIPEGTMIKEMAYIFQEKFNIEPEIFISFTEDSLLINSLDIDAKSLEGYLFPDTYLFSEASTPEMIITKMVGRFQTVMAESIGTKLEMSGMNLHNTLTLASIVEGECIIDSERVIVASLYLNRLAKNMRLESDPTIQYIIPDGPRRLYNKDLRIRNPYNTYRYKGLPPGPINNPGLSSIMAAVEPAETDYIYMVAKGDGSHRFTHNYFDFLQAKSEFQKYRQKIQNHAETEN